MAQDLQRRIRHLFRSRQKQVAAIGQKAENQLEHNFLRKLSHLLGVRRFVAAWLVLVVLLVGCVVAQINALGGYYQTMQPAAGGLYTEGVVGSFTNANPLYAAGQANEAVSKLLFAGLFTYDGRNKLTGNLARDYQVDASGTLYTVHLKPKLTWHDGQPLTAKDVVFTYRTIQNPDAQSPLNRSWQRVAIDAPNDQTVTFKLPNQLSSFPYSLTNGIVPEHVLGKVSVGGLRSVPFNTVRPVGSGPFKFKTIEVKGDTPSTRQVELALEPFAGYYAGAPKLNSFVIHTFADETAMLKSFRDKTISAMVGLRTLPDDLKQDTSVKSHDLSLTAATMVFFKTSSGVLADTNVRKALVGGSNPDQIISGLGYDAIPVRQPILPGQLGYSVANSQLKVSRAEAEKILNDSGWLAGKDGIRSKDGQRLTFKLYAEDTPEYQKVVRTLQAQWKELGADLQIYLQSDADLRSTVAYHSYDALLYGISIGVDPDVFAYWHSSQSDVRSQSRLNFSEYNSAVSDEALEAGRTRTEPQLRAIKYQAFLQAWKQDAPALGLYQPRFLYVTRGDVYGLQEHTITTDTDRFNNVQDWMIRQVPRDKPAEKR